jgi:Uma2 family endonuclease
MASAVPKAKMTVDELLVWAECRPGRYELEAGEVVAMAPERTRHLVAKGDAYLALRRSVERARHRRAGDIIQTRIASEGPLHLDPPGLELSVDDLFAEP